MASCSGRGWLQSRSTRRVACPPDRCPSSGRSPPTIASELIGTSISSDGDGEEVSDEGAIALRENPHIHFHNDRRGYVSCSVTPDRWRADFRALDYVSQPGAPLGTRATFVVADGRPGALRA
jgi:alkaline phosphatase D